MNYCTACGQHMAHASAFCTACGHQRSQSSVQKVPSNTADGSVAPTSSPRADTGHSRIRRRGWAGVAALVAGVAVLSGGVAYAAASNGEQASSQSAPSPATPVPAGTPSNGYDDFAGAGTQTYEGTETYSPAVDLSGRWVGYSTSAGYQIKQTVTLVEGFDGEITGEMLSVSSSGKKARTRLVGSRSGPTIQLDQVQWLTPRPDGWWLASLTMTHRIDTLSGQFTRLGENAIEGDIDLGRTSGPTT